MPSTAPSEKKAAADAPSQSARNAATGSPAHARGESRANGGAVRHDGLQGWAIVAVGVIACVTALRLGSGFFVPVIASLIIALALAPIVRLLARWMPRGIAVAIVVGTLLGASGLLAYSLADETAAAVAEMPRATRQLRQALRAATNGRQAPMLEQLRKSYQELQQTASESTSKPTTPEGVLAVQVVEPPFDFGVAGLSTSAISIVSQSVMMFFLVYFLLACGELFKQKLVRLSGDRLSKRRVTVEAIDQIVERVAHSLLHLIFTGIIVGVATWLAFWYLNVNYAALWGIAAGLLNAVPYFGPTIVGIAATLAALLQFGNVTMAALVGGVSIVITAIEGMLLTPLLFGQLARVNPVAVFLSALFWGWLWGPWGLLLALPLLVIVKTIAEVVDDLKPLAELLSD